MTVTMGGMAAPAAMPAGHDAAPAAAGPRVEVTPTFPGPGPYGLWAQFEAPDGAVVTVRYVIDVR
jgi:hypothetical protein